jgi:hypothetical protein
MRRFLANLFILTSLATPLALQPMTGAAQVIAPAPSPSSCATFTRDLKTGMNGVDVKALQKFLNARGFIVSQNGPGSPGFETTLFGAKTRTALVKFQSTNTIVPAAGYLGIITRAKILLVCSGRTTTLSTPSTGSGQSGTGNGVAFTPTLSPKTIPPVIGTNPPTPSPAPITTATITPSSIVGILCTYNNDGVTTLMKGSGIIVNPQGYILTARHVVDPRWTLAAYGTTLSDQEKTMYANAVLDHCEIGLPENATLPSTQDIRTFNPQTLITRHFQYRADIFFTPNAATLSSNEYDTADVAVLHITSATADCASWNHACAQFGAFPYTPVETTANPVRGIDEVVSYGYPAEAGLNHEGDAFNDFYLKGAVGTVGFYMSGNQRFAGQPLNFAFEAQDIQNGRSGSPLFAKGRVVGILYGSTSSQESYNVSMTAIAAMLADAGQSMVLETQ